MANEQVASYFDDSIWKYNRRDVEELMSHKLGAGPLLACVCNGIDGVGGMLYGFDLGSRCRSMLFMMKFMQYTDQHAEMIYRVMRCGIVHEGMPKFGVGISCPYDNEVAELLYKERNGTLVVNVLRLAKEYLCALQRVNQEARERLEHLPRLDEDDKRIFEAVARSVKPPNPGDYPQESSCAAWPRP